MARSVAKLTSFPLRLQSSGEHSQVRANSVAVLSLPRIYHTVIDRTLNVQAIMVVDNDACGPQLSKQNAVVLHQVLKTSDCAGISCAHKHQRDGGGKHIEQLNDGLARSSVRC